MFKITICYVTSYETDKNEIEYPPPLPDRLEIRLAKNIPHTCTSSISHDGGQTQGGAGTRECFQPKQGH